MTEKPLSFGKFIKLSKLGLPPRRWSTTTDYHKPNSSREPYGIVLDGNELVIDIDPRNGGDRSLQKLIEVVPTLKPSLATAPTVDTGRNGTHFYFLKPPQVKIKKSLEEYPGIDFLSKGQFVVGPGSSLDPAKYGKNRLAAWTGKYRFDIFSEALSSALLVGSDLLSLIETKQPAVSIQHNSPRYSPTQLKTLLNNLPVKDFRSYEMWRNLMFAVKAASGEGGKKHFLQWCIKDHRYREDIDSIDKLWVAATEIGGITSKTLDYFCRLHGVDPETELMQPTVFKSEKATNSSHQREEYVTTREVWDDYYFIARDNRFYCRSSGVEMCSEAFNIFFREMKSGAANEFLDSMEYRSHRVLSSRYEPYWPITFKEGRNVFVNRWIKPPSFKGKCVQPWLDHVNYLFNGNLEYVELFHKYLSALFQKKRRRLNVTLVLYSKEEGVGKTSPLRFLFSKRFGAKNVKGLTNDVITSAFNSSVTDAEVVIYEEADATKRYAILNKMKAWVTDEFITRHAKGKDAEDVKNFASYIVLTNNKDALAITEQDRRYLVLECEAQPAPYTYFVKLFDYLKENVGAIINYYDSRGLDFETFARRAVRTKTADEMRAASLPEQARAILMHIQEHVEPEIPYADEFLIPALLHDKFFINKGYAKSSPTDGRFSKAFSHLGYTETQRISMAFNGKKKRVRIRSKSKKTVTAKEVRQQWDFIAKLETNC